MKHFVVKVALLSMSSTAFAQVCGPEAMSHYQKLSAPETRYQLLNRFEPARFCDPDCFGPCSLIHARKNAENVFSDLKKDPVAFRAITQHLSLTAADPVALDDELKIYGEYKRLSCAVSLTAAGKVYKFIVPAANGFRVEGNIDSQGNITIASRLRTILACPK